MDSFTLVVACALGGMIMAGSMGMLYLASARRVCLSDWAMAGLCFAGSSVMAAFATRYPLHPVLAPAAGNLLYIAGHYGILAGLRRHLNLDPRWDVLAWLAPAVLGAHLLPAVQASVLNRLLLFTPLVAAINLSAVRVLWRRPADSREAQTRQTRLAYLPMIVLQLLFMLQLVLRAAYLAVRESIQLTFMGSEFLQTSGSLFALVFMSVATTSCALIVTHEQALALRRASLTDVLTGWLNRRALHDIATGEFRRSRRSGAAIHFITFDIDHFKSINDRHGHGVGDAAIRHVTAVSAQVLRGCDALFRMGGEEFAVLLADSRLADVCRVAERLRETVAASPLQADGHDVHMTVSVGVAALGADDARWEDILRRADEALYHAKQNGRNRLSVHGLDVCGKDSPARFQAMAT